MSVPFVASLRTQGEPIRLGSGADGGILHVRVEIPELWTTVRVDAPATEPVLAVKVNALQAMGSVMRSHDEYVVKLNGFEILDERASLAAAGVRDGSTLLVTGRRRRPVR
jgi:hypothetical protein